MPSIPEAKPSGTRGATDWRSIVLRADPDYAVESEDVPEYEFGSRHNQRVFKGRYKTRGAYE